MRNRGYVHALRFSALTPLYDSVMRATMRDVEWREMLLTMMPPEPSARTPDIGCGTGTFARLLLERNTDATLGLWVLTKNQVVRV